MPRTIKNTKATYTLVRFGTHAAAGDECCECCMADNDQVRFNTKLYGKYWYMMDETEDSHGQALCRVCFKEGNWRKEKEQPRKSDPLVDALFAAYLQRYCSQKGIDPVEYIESHTDPVKAMERHRKATNSA